MSTAPTCAQIDLGRYPLDRPESPTYGELLADCEGQLGERGAAVLEGFVPAEALARIVQEVTPALPKAFYKTKSHSPYLIADDPAFPQDHPRNRKQRTDSATLAYDDLPSGATIDALYRDPAFCSFLADVLGFPALYPYADNLTPLNILLYQEGQSLGWHFDVSTFVVTLMLAEAEDGGAFEYAPFIRSDWDENYEAVGRILEGRAPELVQELHQGPGALVIFRGSRTLHRVSPIRGPRARLMAVFSYAPQPGTFSDPHNLKTFYGRTS